MFFIGRFVHENFSVLQHQPSIWCSEKCINTLLRSHISHFAVYSLHQSLFRRRKSRWKNFSKGRSWFAPSRRKISNNRSYNVITLIICRTHFFVIIQDGPRAQPSLKCKGSRTVTTFSHSIFKSFTKNWTSLLRTPSSELRLKNNLVYRDLPSMSRLNFLLKSEKSFFRLHFWDV